MHFFYLKYGKTRLAEVVKCTTGLFVLEATAENLHPQKCKNENKENEEYEEGIDGCYGVNQALNQITHGGPVSAIVTFRLRSSSRTCQASHNQNIQVLRQESA